jgi:hypothetical protein
MRRDLRTTALHSIAVIAVCAAMGVAFSRGAGPLLRDDLAFAVAGGIIGCIAAVITAIYRPLTREIEQAETARQFTWVRVSVGGFLLGVLGALIGVFVSETFGRLVAVLGLVVFVIGFVVNIIQQLMIRSK